ncbi:MAG: hypothetical protein R3E95_20590 [Thiolinea sp.]
MLQGEIAALLKSLQPQGKVLTECAIYTHKGTKVADVAWASFAVYERIREETECSRLHLMCLH